VDMSAAGDSGARAAVAAARSLLRRSRAVLRECIERRRGHA